VSVRADTNWAYNGCNAVVLENEELRLVILPGLGGKIFQLTDRRSRRDLLWHNPRLTAREVPFGSSYDDVFFGGWDELFPNDLPETLADEPFPDHGELWASRWQWQLTATGPDVATIVLTLRAPISGVSLTKTITLADGDSHATIAWNIRNDGGYDLPFLWKQHVAVPTLEPATLEWGARTVYLEEFGSPRAGRKGTSYTWPYLIDEQGVSHDMRPTLPKTSRRAEFQYATSLTAGWCAVRYHDGHGIGLSFDATVFPSCWAFASYGGWRSHEVLVLEPCTGYPVSVEQGVAAGTHRVFPAGGVIETSMTVVAFRGCSEISHIDRRGRVTMLERGSGPLVSLPANRYPSDDAREGQ